MGEIDALFSSFLLINPINEYLLLFFFLKYKKYKASQENLLYTNTK